MIKRTIDISEGPTFLSIELDQLVVQRDSVEVGRVPCEDIGLLLVEAQATIYTHSVFSRLLEKGAAVVICGPDHLPAGLLLPLDSNQLQVERQVAQVRAPIPLLKRLWQ
jgi:CRISP-associated protein Cas1